MPSEQKNANTSSVALKKEIKAKLMAWVSEKAKIQVNDCDRR